MDFFWENNNRKQKKNSMLSDLTCINKCMDNGFSILHCFFVVPLKLEHWLIGGWINLWQINLCSVYKPQIFDKICRFYSKRQTEYKVLWWYPHCVMYSGWNTMWFSETNVQRCGACQGWLPIYHVGYYQQKTSIIHKINVLITSFIWDKLRCVWTMVARTLDSFALCCVLNEDCPYIECMGLTR